MQSRHAGGQVVQPHCEEDDKDHRRGRSKRGKDSGDDNRRQSRQPPAHSAGSIGRKVINPSYFLYPSSLWRVGSHRPHSGKGYSQGESQTAHKKKPPLGEWCDSWQSSSTPDLKGARSRAPLYAEYVLWRGWTDSAKNQELRYSAKSLSCKFSHTTGMLRTDWQRAARRLSPPVAETSMETEQ